MNKKGASLQGWAEIAFGVIIVMAVMGIILVNMNEIYNKNNSPTFGIVTDPVLEDLKGYQGTLSAGVEGETSTNAFTGISLSTIGSILISAITIMWSVVTGGWIEGAVALLHLGSAGTWLALALRVLFVFSIGFILIKLILKVNP